MNKSKQLLRIVRRIESLIRQAQPLARIIDQPEHDSPEWLKAAAELLAVAVNVTRWRLIPEIRI